MKIEGLGTFYATIECAKGGAMTKEKFNVQKHIEGLHIRFLPEQEQETNISSRQFLKQAEFVNIDTLLKKEEEGNGSNGSTDSGNNGSQNSGNSGSENSGSGSQNSGSEQNQNESETVQAPEISGSTPFTESTQVSIQGPQGAEVRYTTDGSTPSASSTLYSEPFALTDSATVKAIAILDGNSSEVTSKAFTKSSGGSAGFENGN